MKNELWQVPSCGVVRGDVSCSDVAAAAVGAAGLAQVGGPRLRARSFRRTVRDLPKRTHTTRGRPRTRRPRTTPRPNVGHKRRITRRGVMPAASTLWRSHIHAKRSSPGSGFIPPTWWTWSFPRCGDFDLLEHLGRFAFDLNARTFRRRSGSRRCRAFASVASLYPAPLWLSFVTRAPKYGRAPRHLRG